MTVKVKIRNLTVHYGPKQALSDVSLDIADRSVTALIGPSGCGKSTFLRAINRMNDLMRDCAQTGGVEIDGRDIYAPDADPVAVRRRVGMLFQHPNPFAKSIFENVAYGLRVAGTLRKDTIGGVVEQALRRAALWDEVKDRLKDSAMGLSGGQQQRLCLARALAVNPSLLLMDEPTSALDPIATAKIEELIRELARDYAVVIVTHNMQQAVRISERTAFFYLGELVESDRTEVIFTGAAQQRTREYVSGKFG